jgi:DNA-binding beta-propeller fold protein YncE
MSDLFISHSSGDNAKAKELEQELAKLGHHSVFLDFDPELGIGAGQNWERTLYAKLRACRVVIALCSDHYINSKWCFAELALARMEGKQVFTLLVDPLEASNGLPSILSDCQCIDLRSDPVEGYIRLWRGLKAMGIEKSDARNWSLNDSPYPGLMSFQESDSAIFFARERETDEAIELLNRASRVGWPRLLLVLGASGSGKSSLVRAGLVPRMCRDTSQWIVVGPMQPSAQPIQSLAAAFAVAGGESRETMLQRLAPELSEPSSPAPSSDALTSIATELALSRTHLQPRVLLVVDQFEELLGHASGDHQANRFLLLLKQALTGENSPLFVLAAMRSDYLDALQQNGQLAGLDFKNLSLGPLSEQGLRDVIERPAELGGIVLENGLADALVRDTGTTDALPLLAFTLRVMWDRHHQRHHFSIAEYEALGRLQGAVANEAEAVLQGTLRLGSEEDLRRAFLRMARVTEDGSSFSRQPVRWDELPERAHPMLRHLVNNRLLLSRGDGTVEVSHEALFRSWQRLSDWLNEDREFMLWHRRLGLAMAEWTRTGEDPGALLHGRALSEAEQWVKTSDSDLTETEREFVSKSITLREREEQTTRDAEAAQVRERRKTRQRTWLALAAIPSTLIITLITGIIALAMIVSANMEIENPIVALAFSDGSGKLTVAKNDRNLTVWDLALRTAIGSPMEGDIIKTGAWETAAISPNQRFVVTASRSSDNGTLWDLDSRNEVQWSPTHNSSVGPTFRSLAFSPDNNTFAAAGDGQTIVRWDIAAAKVIGEPIQAGQGKILCLAYSPDGQWLASGGVTGTIALWDPATGRQRGVLSKVHYENITALAFSMDNRILASGSTDKTIQIWDVASQKKIGDPIYVGNKVVDLSFSPVGQRLAGAVYAYNDDEESLFIWEVTPQGLSGGVAMPAGPDLSKLSFSSDGRMVAVGNQKGEVVLWDIASRQPVGSPIK